MIRPGVVLLVCACLVAHAADERPARKSGAKQPVQTSTCSDVPAHPFDVILGRPMSNAVTVSVLCYADTEGWLAYGAQRGNLSSRTPNRTDFVAAAVPVAATTAAAPAWNKLRLVIRSPILPALA